MTDWSSQQIRNILLLTFAVIILFFIALSIGPTTLPIFSALQDILNGNNSLDAIILQDIRFPRALLAIIVGATLGVCGAAMQGLLRNPLACPSVIGISNGAALGAVMALYFGWSAIFFLAVPFVAIIGAGVATLLIFLLAGREASVTTLILAGVAINALGGALIALALNFSPNPYAMSELVYWLLGSLSNRSMEDVYLALPFSIAGWFLLMRSSNYLNALSLGEDTAHSLGFAVNTERTQLIIAIALCIGAAVAVSGSIGFVGLVVPHLLRPLTKHEPGKLLGFSALGGAALVLLADCAVQWISPWQEIKLGVITSLVGGPFFLYLILSTRNSLP
jgi:iron complex transport system permease protein